MFPFASVLPLLFSSVTGLVALLLAVTHFKRARKYRQAPANPAGQIRSRSQPVLSGVHQEWFRAISGVLPGQHVFPRVALEEIVGAGGEPSAALQAACRAAPVDFLVVHRDLTVACAILLVNSSKTGLRRTSLWMALEEAGVPTLVYDAADQVPDSVAIVRDIAGATGARSQWSRPVAKFSPLEQDDHLAEAAADLSQGMPGRSPSF
jgi:hypothetical protein